MSLMVNANQPPTGFQLENGKNRLHGRPFVRLFKMGTLKLRAPFSIALAVSRALARNKVDLTGYVRHVVQVTPLGLTGAGKTTFMQEFAKTVTPKSVVLRRLPRKLVEWFASVFDPSIRTVFFHLRR
jgi:hypothetical protein